MGSVYRCHNRSARRILAAIKVLDKTLQRHTSIRARFIREGELLFSLDHPNIVKVRNIRMDADPPYLEMEFIEGISLESKLERGALPLKEALNITRQLTAALVHLHERGIRHRDVKPSNILVQPDGVVKLVDFGIATESDGSTLAEGGQVFGSVAFVPPEWIEPGKLDPALWDLYALGVCLYEMLTGKIAFDIPANGTPSQRFFQVIMAKQSHPPLDPGPEFSPPLRKLVQRLTHSDMRQRFERADELLQRLQEIDPTPIHNPTLVIPEPPAPPPPRHRILGLLGVGAGLVLLMALGLSLFNTSEAPRTREVLVLLSGLENFPVSVQIAQHPPIETTDLGQRFAPLPPGEYQVEATLGQDCAQSPTTCGHLSTTLVLPEGTGTFTLPWILTPPLPRHVCFVAPKAGLFQASINAQPQQRTGTLCIDTQPGRLSVKASAGDCPNCSEWEGILEVPWGDGPLELEIPLEAPPVPPPVVAPVKPNPPSSGPGSLVSNRQLARWLSSHPEWQAGGENALKSSGPLLKGWTEATPPAGQENQAAMNISWALAAAYCRSHGGLADVQAAPQTWTETATIPWHEYRQRGGEPAYVRSDGTQNKASLKANFVQASTGMRCAH